MKINIRKSLTFLRKTLIIHLAVFVLAELVANVVFYINNKQIFYFRSPAPQENAYDIQSQEELIKKQKRPMFVLHPYFGLIRTPGITMKELAGYRELDLNHHFLPGQVPPWLDMTVNNHGFFSNYSYPYQKNNKDEYIIAIFGGSVAQWFSIQGKERLFQQLRRHPFFKNKTITLLNFASGGYKQPQQLQILTYFLSQGQELDFVINIDGFNDLAFGIENIDLHLHPSMPNGAQLLPLLRMLNPTLLTIDELKEYSRLISLAEKTQQYRESANKTIFASVYIFKMTYYHYLEKKLANARTHYQLRLAKTQDKIGLIYHLLSPGSGTSGKDDKYNNMIADWSNSSLLMHQLLTARSIPYLHIIQPNQYYSKKKFTADEKKYAFAKNSPYRKYPETGYPLLEKEAQVLGKTVAIKSGIAIFDNVKETVYSDSCCHYNQRGNEILADFVAQELISLLVHQHALAEKTRKSF